VPTGEAAAAPAKLMPPPLSSASPQAAPEPYQPFGKLNPRKRLPWLIAFGAMALIIGGQFYYILTQDEAIVNERKQRPPVSVVPLAHTDKAPIDVTNNGGVAQTPSAAYLQKLSPSISSGSLPLLIIENNSYRLGNLIGPADLGLRWTQINDNTKTLEFIDKTGQRYDLKF
jgi:hypothetical protein